MARASEQRRLNARNGDGDGDLIRAGPVLARVALGAWLRATGWTVQTSIAASSRIVRGAANGESPATILRDVESELREHVGQLRGIAPGGGCVRRLRGIGEAAEGSAPGAEPVDAEVVEEDDALTIEQLRERGRDL